MLSTTQSFHSKSNLYNNVYVYYLLFIFMPSASKPVNREMKAPDFQKSKFCYFLIL